MISLYQDIMISQIKRDNMDKKKEEKVPMPLRMSNVLYKKVRDFVNQKKDKERGYSINKFVIEAIEEKIEKEKNNGKKGSFN